MDYLTIISSRFLILFPSSESILSLSPSSPATSYGYFANSPLSSPTTPNITLVPTPIALPISSLIYNDRNCVYFLIHHLIQTATAPHPHDNADDEGWGNSHELTMHKQLSGELKVMACKELDKFKMFQRALGNWFNSNQDKMMEGELRELANKFGLGLEPLEHEKINHQVELTQVEGSYIQRQDQDQEDEPRFGEKHRHRHVSNGDTMVLA